MSETVTPAEVEELLAHIARRRKFKYQLAAEIGLHPVRLGRMLTGRTLMPHWVYESACERLKVIRTTGGA